MHERSQRRWALVHQSPRLFGNARSTWTLALAAEVCVEHGIIEPSGSVMRPSGTRSSGVTAGRLAAGQDLDHQPGPTILRSKKLARPPDPLGGSPRGLGGGLCRSVAVLSRRARSATCGAAWRSRPFARLGRRRCGCTPKREPRTMPEPKALRLLRAVADRSGSGAASALSRVAQSAASPRSLL